MKRSRITPALCLLLLCAGFFLPLPRLDAQEQDDLGGPCVDQPTWNQTKEIEDAEKGGDWNHAVALRKQEVRAACTNEYRWYALVNALINAHLLKEASGILERMDSRGFEVNPSFIETQFPAIAAFLNSEQFAASPLGAKIQRLEKISDERRARFLQVLHAMPASDKPPENYVAYGACPFECCRFGNWTTTKATRLVDSPGSTHIVGTLAKGSRVVALTGEVHLNPVPVVVLFQGELPKNSIVFILDYLGEGGGHVYTQGKVVALDLNYARYCFHPSESCWGETLVPATERKKPVWWAKIRLPNGAVGWTSETDHFDGKDGCA